jgi:SM-20-related protein
LKWGMQNMRNVEIEVTLNGGETHKSVLPSNSPLLVDLHVGLANSQSGNAQQPGVLIQLPIDGGQAAVSFMSTSVVSITSRPAVLIQATQNVAWATAATPPYVRIDDFLTPAENEQLLQYAIENQEHFEVSKVIDDPDRDADDSPRKSQVLFAIKESKWKKIFIERLKQHLPHLKASLGVPGFRFQGTEIQLTASNDGDFFKRHADADHNIDTVALRVVTFVYYLHRMPKPFSGGDLLLYGDGAGGQVTAISPQNNCLVSFASNCWHEVDFVRCPSRAFADSRFTINGWLRSDTM